MAMRYDGIEFDNVEELIEYKRQMARQIKPKPIDYEYVGKTEQKVFKTIVEPKRKTGYRRVSVAEANTIRQMRRQGMKIKDIAAQTGRAKSKIWLICKGVRKRKPDLNETIVRDRESGMSYGKIGKKVGMSKGAVFQRYMKHRKAFLPQSYEQRATKLAEKQTSYHPFPNLCDENAMLRLSVKNLIDGEIDLINQDYADSFGIKDWGNFLTDFMASSGDVAKHFGVPNKFRIADNRKIEYKR